jgi:hypothetical protein
MIHTIVNYIRNPQELNGRLSKSLPLMLFSPRYSIIINQVGGNFDGPGGSYLKAASLRRDPAKRCLVDTAIARLPLLIRFRCLCNVGGFSGRSL